MSAHNPLDEIARAVGPRLDLWQPRDWPHRRGDEIKLDLLSFPLTETSGGRRPVACENCGQECLCIHDNVLCWKCKGCFCYGCTNADEPSGIDIPGVGRVVNPSFDTPMTRILEQGFGTCPNCQEPLRSIAMIDVFRQMMESMFDTAMQRGPFGNNTGKSLVQEAEDALKRAEDASGTANSERAISEYTHALNACNYLASASQGSRLVLRAKDILLIAHAERALLEGNTELRSAILNAFPTASVRECKGEARTMTKSAFMSLFYPLPADVMVGASGGTILRVDMRNDTRDGAFKSTEWDKQLQILNVTEESARAYVEMNKQSIPSLEGVDELFDSLKGTLKGLWVHQCHNQTFSTTMTLGDHTLTTGMVIQFIRSFPTDTAAQEYTRLIAEKKRIGEERHHKEDPVLKKSLKGLIKGMGVADFHRVTVLKGEFGTMRSISTVVAVGNVSTKIFVQAVGVEGLETACYLVAKAVSFLDRRLQEIQNSPRAVAHHHPDLTTCAYCGKCGQPSLKTCTRCKLAKYCGVSCQKRHWEMRGPFAHKPFCKSVVRQARSNS